MVSGLEVSGALAEVSPLEEGITKIKIVPWEGHIESATIVFFGNLSPRYENRVVNYQEFREKDFLVQNLRIGDFSETTTVDRRRVDEFRKACRREYIPQTYVVMRT